MNMIPGHKLIITVLAVVIAYVARYALVPLFDGYEPYMTFLAANILVAHWAGFRYGMLSFVLGLGGVFIFIHYNSDLEGALYGKYLFSYLAAYIGLSLVFMRFVSQNAKARKREREINEFYETLVQKHVLGIWRFDLKVPMTPLRSIPEQIDYFYEHGYLADCNMAFVRMYGLERREQLLGKKLGELLVRDDPQNTLMITRFIENGHRLANHESVEIDAQGGRKIFLNTMEAHWDDGCLVGAWGTQFDITEFKQLEDRMAELLERERQTRQEVEEISEAKDYFLATLSHEMRTPMNVIAGRVQMLPRDPARLENALAVITRNVQALQRIINDVLDMSRIIVGKFEIKPGKVSMLVVLDEALDTVRQGIAAKGISLVVSTDPSIPPVCCDHERLRQVFWNLLSNALKFTKKGGTITVRAFQSLENVVVQVEDTGVGFTPEFKVHMFERFRQADSTSTREVMGLGVGLAIAKHLVELQGGEIEAHSDGQGLGSVFTVRLPVYIEAVNGYEYKKGGGIGASGTN